MNDTDFDNPTAERRDAANAALKVAISKCIEAEFTATELRQMVANAIVHHYTTQAERMEKQFVGRRRKS